MQSSKVCSKCKELFPLTNFYKNKSKWAGYNSYCKSCIVIYHQTIYDETPKRKAYKKAYFQTEKYKKLHRETTKRLYKENPIKFKARKLANKYGVKKEVCEMCAGIRGELHLHHFNYDKPLDVITVCEPCHHSLHRKYNRTEVHHSA